MDIFAIIVWRYIILHDHVLSCFIYQKYIKVIHQVISDLGSGDPFLSGLWYLPPGCSAARGEDWSQESSAYVEFAGSRQVSSSFFIQMEVMRSNFIFRISDLQFVRVLAKTEQTGLLLGCRFWTSMPNSLAEKTCCCDLSKLRQVQSNKNHGISNTRIQYTFL